MNRFQPFVSVILPVYNDPQGIKKCIDSLVKQNYQKERYEIIIVDNASKPPIEINPSLSNHVKLIKCLTPGSYAARNAGVKVAKGEVMAFTDADCIPDKNWLLAGINALEVCQRKCIIGGEVELYMPPKPTSIELYQCITGFLQKENIERLCFTATANLFVGKDVFNRVGFFNEALLSGGDREWCWRATTSGLELKYIADAVVKTYPRRTITSAIRQAFRVAGGRYGLRRMNLAHVQSSSVKPHRSSLDAFRWIMNLHDLSAKDRFRVLSVAVIIKISSIFEAVRLMFFGKQAHR